MRERGSSEDGGVSDCAPLDGLVVLDLTRALAGPHAAMMLGDMGARVIKVESLEGDDSRRWGPPFVGGESTYFLSCNRNKQSIALNLRTGDDLATVRRLIAKADVLMENFRPGVLDRLGLGMEELRRINPRLVILSITGFGHDGPESARPGYDQIAQAEGGLMSLTGDGAPTKVGVPIADLLAGMNGAFGVMVALHERERTGVGRVVRTSLLAGMVSIHAFQGTRWTVAGEVPQPSGSHHATIAPYGMFAAQDSSIQVACGTQEMWEAFAEIVGIDPCLGAFLDNASRVENRALLVRRIEERLAPESADHWLIRLSAAGVPCGRVRTLDEVYRSEQVISQGLVIAVDHPAGTLELPGPPIRFDALAHAGGREKHRPPPLLDEHHDEIIAWSRGGTTV
jgi:crotonobetainyl-CoA:carnitine CoA-transferase CaiB-like acyl-CoA transferase